MFVLEVRALSSASKLLKEFQNGFKDERGTRWKQSPRYSAIAKYNKKFMVRSLQMVKNRVLKQVRQGLAMFWLQGNNQSTRKTMKCVERQCQILEAGFEFFYNFIYYCMFHFLQNLQYVTKSYWLKQTHKFLPSVWNFWLLKD